MTFFIRCAAVLSLLVIGFAAVGCGETVIDDVKAEEAIQSNLEKSLDAKIKSVDCPADEKVETGKTFTCAVVYSDGNKETATLKILNEDADVSLVGLKPTK